MRDDKPQWQGVTLYLVTDKTGYWIVRYTFEDARVIFAGSEDENDPHVWECQIGYEPNDVTAEARKLVGA